MVEIVGMNRETDPHGKDPHTPGAKLDQGKPNCALVFTGFAEALLEVARVGTYGASKYTPNGWMEVPNGIERYSSAAFRHLLARNYTDPESALPHLAHAAWNVLAALEIALRDMSPEDIYP